MRKQSLFCKALNTLLQLLHFHFSRLTRALIPACLLCPFACTPSIASLPRFNLLFHPSLTTYFLHLLGPSPPASDPLPVCLIFLHLPLGINSLPPRGGCSPLPPVHGSGEERQRQRKRNNGESMMLYDSRYSHTRVLKGNSP